MSDLKLTTARTLKWNAVDRISSQVLYAVTGVVLANLLSQEDFGLTGALLVFQAFAILFVDSGFGAALLQRKDPDERDYSTVFWFNLAVGTAVYAILFFCAPLIADIFQGDRRLIPLSRVMFLTFILNGLAIVQTNRLMKRMDVKQIAVANMAGLTAGGVAGIWLAVKGCGAWALVWQSVISAAVKSGWLWLTGGWRPRAGFHLTSLRRIWRVGLSVFSSSALNTLFLYIYSFIIGAFYNLTALGVYTQADKWSKMGSASISQILTSSFVPLLARVQDDGAAFRRYVTRINRFTAFILFPAMASLALAGEPLFHLLFAEKWDSAILLFRILTVRGIFVVLVSLYSNYLLALGYARRLFAVEVVKDLMILAALLTTVWSGSISILVWGQLAASVLTYIAALAIVCRATGYGPLRMFGDLLPFILLTLCATAAASLFLLPAAIPGGLPLRAGSLLRFAGIFISGGGVFLILGYLFKIPELSEAISYLSGRFRRSSK